MYMYMYIKSKLHPILLTELHSAIVTHLRQLFPLFSSISPIAISVCSSVLNVYQIYGLYRPPKIAGPRCRTTAHWHVHIHIIVEL